QPHLLILLTVLQPSGLVLLGCCDACTKEIMESPYSDYFGIIWKITAKIATVMVVIPSTYSDSNQRCCAK
ncbi:unnamed protein product, partial [Urochloa humidicola]